MVRKYLSINSAIAVAATHAVVTPAVNGSLIKPTYTIIITV